MPFDVVMPQMGESIAEATLLKWHRQVGEAVKADETLYEISTDKVDAEIPAPESGTLLAILVAENETVPVGTIVARIGAASDLAPAPPPVASETAPAAPPVEPPSTPQPPPVAAPDSLEERLRTRSSPLVRRMAEAHQVDLGQLRGSGLQGRVTKADLEAHLTRPAAAVPAASQGVSGDRTRLEPLSRMRRIIADNMVLSKHTAAHTYTVFEIDMSRVARLRQAHRQAFEAAFGAKLSFLPFVLASVTKALRAFPIVNARLEGEGIVHNLDIHLGVAVALDWGLLVPVLRNADQLSLGGLATGVQDLASRARAKQLRPDEIQGGTFTITNPGVYGDLFGMPVILQPQSAILAMGAVTKRAVVVTAADGTDSIAIRSVMFSTLSFDHRLVDGAVADQFMAAVKRELEQGDFGLG
jgi:pyruvate dehydrogenase E2 component (dihydrolipoamide acetyltransferase)